jgi:hypothetical protein
MAGAGKRKRVTRRKKRKHDGAFMAVVGNEVVAGYVGLRVKKTEFVNKVLFEYRPRGKVSRATLAFVAKNGPHFMSIMGGPYKYDPD